MVVGGFGGVGRSVCHWLAEHGAKSLVVISRGASDGKIVQLKSELSDIGKDVQVTAVGCDISDLAALNSALDNLTNSGVPPIKGIVHGGMDLRVCFPCPCELNLY